MSRTVNGGPKLPRALLDQVDNQTKNHSARRAQNHRIFNRKDRRKAERTEKKQWRGREKRNGHIGQNVPRQKQEEVSDEDIEHEDDEEDEEEQFPEPVKPVSKAKSKDVKLTSSNSGTEIKRRSDSTSKKNSGARVQSPPRISRREREKLEAEDEEIARLEKKLGIKSRKTPSASGEDGLADLLADLDEEDDENASVKRKRTEDDQWLKDKRRKVVMDTHSRDKSRIVDDEDVSYDEDLSMDEDEDEPLLDSENDAEDESLDSAASFEGFDSETSDEPEAVPKRERENPYVAPSTNHIETPAKYIPPSMRGAPSSDAELQQRLRRQIQGQLNRLSEANILSILSEITNFFQSNPRQYVTSILIDLLINLIADRTTLHDPFIILHSGFIAAVYKMHGQDFGAQMIEQIVTQLDTNYSKSIDKPEARSDKKVVNLVSLLSQLYNLQVIGSELIFNLIRTYLSSLSELHTELLLRLVRSSGPQLRSDNPSALQDIVLLLQRTISQTPESDISVRTKFMVETINDLKNNKLKAGAATSAMTAEHLTKIKKTVTSLNQRAGVKATEPLRLTLADIRNAEKKGKWWLVGASWKGHNGDQDQSLSERNRNRNHSTKTIDSSDDSEENEDELTDEFQSNPSTSVASTAITTDLNRLARENNMTTPLRRSIFTTLLTSADYQDAHTRILKLNLTRAQEQEVPRVLLHCVATEKWYNPFYALVADRLCSSDRKGKFARSIKALGVSLVRQLSGRSADAEDSEDGFDDDDNEEEEEEQDENSSQKSSLSAVVNQAKFFAKMIEKGHLGIGVLKPLDFSPHLRTKSKGLKPKASIFAEVLLVTLIVSVPVSAPSSSPYTASTKSYSSNRHRQELPFHDRDRNPDRDLDGGRDTKNEGPSTLKSIFHPYNLSSKNPGFKEGLRRFVKKVVRKSDLIAEAGNGVHNSNVEKEKVKRRKFVEGMDVVLGGECLGSSSNLDLD